MHFDIRSSLLTSFVTSSLGAVLIGLLWRQNRRRFAGVGYWFADSVLKTLAFLLIGLRGSVPLWLSVIGAAGCALAGLACVHVGLEEFFELRPLTGWTSRRRHVVTLLGFTVLYAALTYVHPSLALRNGVFSLTLAWIAGQSLWLIERRAEPSLRRSARFVSWVMASLVALGLFRVLFMFHEAGQSRDFLESGRLSALVVVVYNIQAVLLVYGLSLLLNDRLIAAERKNAAELADYRRHLEQMVEQRTVALSVAKEAAEDADRAKTAFLGTMSHELRTPLNIIMGMTDVVRMSVKDREQAEQLGMVARASQRLLRLLTDVLDISQLEANRLSLEPAPLQLRAVFDELRALLVDQATSKGLTLSVDLPDELADRALLGDRGRLVQVVFNLVDNAIKFTDRGSVEVHASLIAETAERLRIAISVRDTGPGIAPAHRGRLFRPFEQVDPSFTRKHGGAGLGLAITRRLVERMDGKLTLESEVGVGSTFTCELALAKA